LFIAVVDIDQGGGVVGHLFRDLLRGSLGVFGAGTVNNCDRFHFVVVVTVITTLNAGKIDYVYPFRFFSEKRGNVPPDTPSRIKKSTR
jgi:hypothetical protein